MERQPTWSNTLEFFKQARKENLYDAPTNHDELAWRKDLAITLSYLTTGKAGLRPVANVYGVSHEEVRLGMERVIEGMWERSSAELQKEFPRETITIGKDHSKPKEGKEHRPKKSERIRTLIEDIDREFPEVTKIVFPGNCIPHLHELALGENPFLTTYGKLAYHYHASNWRHGRFIVQTLRENGIQMFESQGPLCYRWLLTSKLGKAHKVLNAIELERGYSIEQVSGRLVDKPPSYSELVRLGRFSAVRGLLREIGNQPKRHKTKSLLTLIKHCPFTIYKLTTRSGTSFLFNKEDEQKMRRYLTKALKPTPKRKQELVQIAS